MATPYNLKNMDELVVILLIFSNFPFGKNRNGSATKVNVIMIFTIKSRDNHDIFIYPIFCMLNVLITGMAGVLPIPVYYTLMEYCDAHTAYLQLVA